MDSPHASADLNHSPETDKFFDTNTLNLMTLCKNIENHDLNSKQLGYVKNFVDTLYNVKRKKHASFIKNGDFVSFSNGSEVMNGILVNKKIKFGIVEIDGVGYRNIPLIDLYLCNGGVPFEIVIASPVISVPPHYALDL